jgi:hypothetical protein
MNKVFCTKCGTELNEASQFCVKCGNAVAKSGHDAGSASPPQFNPSDSDSQDLSADETGNPQSFMSKVVGRAITAIIVIVGALFINSCLSGGGNQQINVVRNGHFEAYPNVTVGRAFDNFYDNAEWSNFEDARGDIVRFTGRWQSSTYEWDFLVHRNSFELVAIRMDGISVGVFWAPTWLETIFLN